MKTPKAIYFNDPWGGKLEKEIFKTVRGQHQLYVKGQEYPVILQQNGFYERKDYGKYTLIGLMFKRICDFSAEEIIQDIGRRKAGTDPHRAFLKILACFYGIRPWWMGNFTVLQVLTFEKVR